MDMPLLQQMYYIVWNMEYIRVCPKLTMFQEKAFPKIRDGAKIEFFGPKAVTNGLPTNIPISKYNFEIKWYHQHTYPK